MEESLITMLTTWLQTLGTEHSWAAWSFFGFTALGGLSTLATAVIAATPTKADDEWLNRVTSGKGAKWFKILDSLSFIRKK